jgi:hypothetical protein
MRRQGFPPKHQMCGEFVMSNASRSRRSFAVEAEKTAEHERAIQKEIDRKDVGKQKKGGKQSSPPQTGARRYPVASGEQERRMIVKRAETFRSDPEGSTPSRQR